jgi:hypothetical protein
MCIPESLLDMFLLGKGEIMKGEILGRLAKSNTSQPDISPSASQMCECPKLTG